MSDAPAPPPVAEGPTPPTVAEAPAPPGGAEVPAPPGGAEVPAQPTVAEAPEPPRGPGVVAPFPAPPTEGRRWRIGVGLGLGAGALLLVCGGGVATAVGLGTVMTRAVNEQVRVVVGAYLDDVRARRYQEAYASLCERTRTQLTEAQFVSEQAEEEPIRSYRVGQLDLASVDLAVPVDVTYADGRTARLQAHLGQDQETGEFQVCSVEE